MEEIKLEVQLRKKVGTRSVKSVRREGFIPAIVYGGERKDPTAIKVNQRKYEKVMRAHQGESVVFHLNVMEGEKKLRDYAAIVKEEQHHPVSEDLIHVDFNRISLDKEIEVTVPISAKGEAIGVKQEGGSLDQALWELSISCLPMKIPVKFEIDVSHLNIGNAIHVSDIVLPDGVVSKNDTEAIVFSVVPPMREAQDLEQEESSQEPEVIGEKEKQGKKDQKEAEKAEVKQEQSEEKKA